MVPEREVLGRGLDQLLGRPLDNAKRYETPYKGELQKESQIFKIAVEKIKPDPLQPRKFFDEKSLLELTCSIEKQGLIQPVLVLKEENNFYTLIAGERRWRAVQKLGWKSIPAIIKNPSDFKEKKQKMLLALMENLQREDLNPIEEARAFYWLLEKNKWSQEQLAKKVARDRSSISNSLRLLELHSEVQDLLSRNKISLSIAKTLLQEKSQEKQKIWAKKAAKEQMTVRELERKLKTPFERARKEVPFWAKEKAGHLARKWAVDLKLKPSSKNISLVLNFKDENELKGFFENV